jgi:hypothetical protein
MAASVTAGRALRCAGGSARGRLLQHPVGHDLRGRGRQSVKPPKPCNRVRFNEAGGGLKKSLINAVEKMLQ